MASISRIGVTKLGYNNLIKRLCKVSISNINNNCYFCYKNMFYRIIIINNRINNFIINNVYNAGDT